jgi:hypothetical protein
VPKDATLTTLAQNRAVLDALPFGDAQDFEDTRRGFLGSLPEVEIKNDKGRVVWSLKEYTFLAEEQAPPDLSARPPERARRRHRDARARRAGPPSSCENFLSPTPCNQQACASRAIPPSLSSFWECSTTLP